MSMPPFVGPHDGDAANLSHSSPSLSTETRLMDNAMRGEAGRREAENTSSEPPVSDASKIENAMGSSDDVEKATESASMPLTLADLSKRPAENDNLQRDTAKKLRSQINFEEAMQVSLAHDQQFLVRDPNNAQQQIQQQPVQGETSTVNQILQLLRTRQDNARSIPNSTSNLLLGDPAVIRAELSAQYLRDQAIRNATNAAFFSTLSRPRLDMLLGANATLPQIGNNGLPFAAFQALQQHSSPSGYDGSLVAAQQQYAHLSALRSIAEFETLRRTNAVTNVGDPSTAQASLISSAGRNSDSHHNLASLLGHIPNLTQRVSSAPLAAPNSNGMFASPSGEAPLLPSPLRPSLSLPPCVEGQIEPHFNRMSYPLGTDEDTNWLSEFHCFVRSELVEVFRASHEEVRVRNNSIAYHQVGIRCRFCAHVTPSARAGRSSAFPSSLRQIYQSFTMMLRDHFGKCDAMPSAVQEKFLALKDKPAQGATDSKRFWIYSAMKIGMADSSDGLVINDRTMENGARALPFGVNPGQKWEDDAFRGVSLVTQNDRSLVPEFLFVLMSQVQLVRLTEAERIGNRRSLAAGLPGFSCRFCCEKHRLGLCRMFPARRRTLPSKVNDLYDHLSRCPLVPASVKEHLERAKQQQANSTIGSDQGGEREFFDRIWSRLGHGGQS